MDIIVLNRKATEKNIDHLLKKLEGKGLKATVSRGTEKTVIGVIGDTSRITEEEENAVRVMKGVEDVVRILKPYKLASRDFKSQNTIIKVKGKVIGGKKIPVIAGPCAVENRAIMINIAEKVKAAGASFIRGGAYKPGHRLIHFRALRGRASVPCRGEQENRAPCCHRDNGSKRSGDNTSIYRHNSDRGKEYAEFQAAA